MSDLALATNGHDLIIANGDLVIADGQDAIAQQLEIRLRFWFGEWFRDRQEGIDFLTFILVKNPQESIIVTLLAKVIRGTPGIVNLNTIVLNYDGSTRTMTVTFTCTCDTGKTLTYTNFELGAIQAG